MRQVIALLSLMAPLTMAWGQGAPAPVEAGLDAEKIGQAAGVKATLAPDGVVRVSWPRTDVAVTVDGVALPTFAGLESWAAFKQTPHGVQMMGDEVLFQDEVSPAIDAAFAAGLEVTALHNHFFYDTPRVYFLHVAGTGEAERLAAGVKAIWDAVKQVREASEQPAQQFPGGTPVAGELGVKQLESILGQAAQTRDGVVKVAIGRRGKMHGAEVGGSMGLSTWAAFTGSDALAAVDGDFIMTANEVQTVLRALRRGGIHIVALHHHMIGDEPAFYFVHFWGKGPAERLAQALRAVLDEQARVGG